VLSVATARAVVAMLEAAVDEDDGAARSARVDGMSIAGGAGTVEIGRAGPDGEPLYSARFVGIVQPDDARVVILVGVEGLHGDHVTGGEVAAPAFARIVASARGASEHIDR
jgi:cell division protein FtsI/penicillin-binding protein 2